MSITKCIPDRPCESFDVSEFVDRRCKTSIDVIQDAVDGTICPEQAVKLRACLAHIDELETHKAAIELEICELVKLYDITLDLLPTISGLDSNPMTAVAILSEVSGDMSVFATAKNLASWAGCCPHNDQSASKMNSTRISHADCYLKPLLVQISNALLHSKKHPNSESDIAGSNPIVVTRKPSSLFTVYS